MMPGARSGSVVILAVLILVLGIPLPYSVGDIKDPGPVRSTIDSIQPLVWGEDVRVVQTIPTDDTQVAEGKPSENYGDSESMYVQSAGSSSAWGNQRIWLRFNMSGLLPPGAEIKYTALRMYLYKADRNSDLSVSCHSSENDTWNQESLTWNTQPEFYQTPQDALVIHSGMEREWVEFNVTDIVSGDSDSTTSLVLKASMEGSSPMKTLNFDSFERDERTAPRLRIYYTGDPADDEKIDIFHFSDIHSRLLPHDLIFPDEDEFTEAGGASAFTSLMLQKKTESPSSLILMGGDYFEGGVLGDLDGGRGTMEWLDLLDSKLESLGGRGIDAAVVGNHDIRDPDYINRMKSDSNIRFISANILEKSTGDPYFDPYVIVNESGKKIGILGYSSDEYSDFGGNHINTLEMAECVWFDQDPTTIDIKEYTRELREDHECDLVILLMHSGHTDLVLGDDSLLKVDRDVRPPEVVVAGHWHTSTETAWQPYQLDYWTTVVEAGPYLEFIGELSINGNGDYLHAWKHPVQTDEITGNTDVDDLISDLMTDYIDTRPDYDPYDIIGYTSSNLTLDRDKWWTISEHPWYGDFTAGMWITDAMVWSLEDSDEEIDLAVQSGGGIRRDIEAGQVTYREIYEAYPWSDDGMVTVERSGKQIWEYLEEEKLSPAVSSGWKIIADDGMIRQINFNGTPISNQTTYRVGISEYMFANEEWGSSSTDTGISIRDSVIEFTSFFNSTDPYSPEGPRYLVEENQWSGKFKALVTMVDDSESESIYETAFLRLLTASDDTIDKRGIYLPEDLVNENGVVNLDHQMAEVMWYRSHLGFNSDLLKPGDMVNVKVEGGFHQGNPQVMEEEGIMDHGIEFDVVGHDPSLVVPEYVSCFNEIDTEFNENHLLKFYAYRESESSVKDSADQVRILKDKGGYHDVDLPGTYGELLEITGIPTFEGTSREFRVVSAEVVTHGFPPCSEVLRSLPYNYVGYRADLEVTARDADGSVDSLELFYSYSSDNETWSNPVSYVEFENPPYETEFIFDEGPGYYSFYSRARDNRGNIEDIPVRKDLTVFVPYIPDLEIYRDVNLTAYEEEMFEIWINLTDGSIHPDSYNVEIETNASWLSIENGTARGVPNSYNIGTFWLSATVSDGRSSDEVNWTITVLDRNGPPSLIYNGSSIAYEDIPYNAVFEIIDPDENDVHSFDFSTNASFLSFNSTTGILNGTPDYNDTGTFWLNATVRDSENESDSLNVTIEVIERNDPPVIKTIPMNTSYQDVPYVLILNGTDEENGTDLHWNLSTTAEFLTIDVEELKIFGTPSETDLGNHSVNISARDRMNSTSYLNFTLEVVPVEGIHIYYNATLNITTQEDVSHIIKILDLFPDAYIKDLSYQLIGSSNIIIKNQDSDSVTLIGKANWSGKENFTIKAQRTWMEINVLIDMNVTPVNDLPVILDWNVKGNMTAGWPITLTASVEDGDIPYGDSIEIIWIDRIRRELGTGEEIEVTYQSGTHYITISVTDSTGNLTEEEFEVSINPSNGVTPIDDDDDDENGNEESGGMSIIAILLIIGAVDVVILGGIGLLIYFRNRKEEQDKEKKREPLPRIDDKELMNQLGFTQNERTTTARGAGFSSIPLPEEPEPPEEEEGPPKIDEMETRDPLTNSTSAFEENMDPINIPPGPHLRSPEPEDVDIPPGPHAGIQSENESGPPVMEGVKQDPFSDRSIGNLSESEHDDIPRPPSADPFSDESKKEDKGKDGLEELDTLLDTLIEDSDI